MYGLRLLGAVLLGLCISLNVSFFGGSDSLAQQPAQSNLFIMAQQTTAQPPEGIADSFKGIVPPSLSTTNLTNKQNIQPAAANDSAVK